MLTFKVAVCVSAVAPEEGVKVMFSEFIPVNSVV
jgi:hypothetical protein